MKPLIVFLCIASFGGLFTWIIGERFITGFLVTVAVVVFFVICGAGGNLFDYFNRFPLPNDREDKQ